MRRKKKAPSFENQAKISLASRLPTKMAPTQTQKMIRTIQHINNSLSRDHVAQLRAEAGVPHRAARLVNQVAPERDCHPSCPSGSAPKERFPRLLQLANPAHPSGTSHTGVSPQSRKLKRLRWILIKTPSWCFYNKATSSKLESRSRPIPQGGPQEPAGRRPNITERPNPTS
jgi:hypothetical protein